MNTTTLIDRYCLVWTEPDAGRRADMLASIRAPNATYTDPSIHAAGAAELLAHIARMQVKRPGARVLRTSIVDVHHDLARFAWHVVLSNASVMIEGIDIAFLTLDGSRIERIIGFFGPLPREAA
jgi:hypothetical protein